jgi:EpsI family protein
MMMTRGIPGGFLTRAAVVFGCLLVARVAVARADRFEVPPSRATLADFPMQVGGWRGIVLPPFAPSALAVLGLNDYLTRDYIAPNRTGVNLYIGYWESQRQGDTIHSPLNCLPGAGWEPLSQTIISVPDSRSPAGGSLPVNRVVVQKGLDRDLVLYWYQSHGRIVASEYASRFHLVVDAVRLNRTDGAIVRVVSPIDGDSPEAEQKAQDTGFHFISVLLPQLAPYLPD